jgi:hypothetical protein
MKAINRLIRRQTEVEKQRKGTEESESDIERLFDSETTSEEAASSVNIQGISKTFIIINVPVVYMGRYKMVWRGDFP